MLPSLRSGISFWAGNEVAFASWLEAVYLTACLDTSWPDTPINRMAFWIAISDTFERLPFELIQAAMLDKVEEVRLKVS